MVGFSHGRPQTFFLGWAKIFQGGQEPTFCLKCNEKDTIFPQKSLKTYYFWPALAGQGGQEPPLPFPADAHGFRHFCGIFSRLLRTKLGYNEQKLPKKNQ
jgi:hypothetical protein